MYWCVYEHSVRTPYLVEERKKQQGLGDGAIIREEKARRLSRDSIVSEQYSFPLGPNDKKK